MNNSWLETHDSLGAVNGFQVVTKCNECHAVIVEWHPVIVNGYTPTCRPCLHNAIAQERLDFECDTKFMGEIMAEIMAQANGRDIEIEIEYPCYLYIAVNGNSFTYGDGNTPNTKCWQTDSESGDDVPDTATPAEHARLFWLGVERWAISRAFRLSRFERSSTGVSAWGFI